MRRKSERDRNGKKREKGKYSSQVFSRRLEMPEAEQRHSECVKIGTRPGHLTLFRIYFLWLLRIRERQTSVRGACVLRPAGDAEMHAGTTGRRAVWCERKTDE